MKKLFEKPIIEVQVIADQIMLDASSFAINFAEDDNAIVD